MVNEKGRVSGDSMTYFSEREQGERPRRGEELTEVV
jgi:hypothetical protein